MLTVLTMIALFFLLPSIVKDNDEREKKKKEEERFHRQLREDIRNARRHY